MAMAWKPTTVPGILFAAILFPSHASSCSPSATRTEALPSLRVVYLEHPAAHPPTPPPNPEVSGLFSLSHHYISIGDVLLLVVLRC